MQLQKNNAIVFITRESYKQAGARVRCYYYAQELQKRGYNAQVLSFADHLNAKSGIEERKISLYDKILLNVISFFRLLAYKDTIFVLQRFNYHAFGPLLAWYFTKNKLIFDIDDWEMCEDIQNSKAAQCIQWIVKKADYSFVASQHLYDFIRHYTSCVTMIPSAIKNKLVKTKKKQNSHFIVTWLGTFYRLHDLENIKFIIDCMREVIKATSMPVKCEIVGEGIYEQELCEYLDEANCNQIFYKGWIEPDHISEYLERIDVGVMPLIQNTRFNKSKSPTKLFEYMSMGKPTVSSAIGESCSIIQNGENGFIAKTKSEFVQYLIQLLEDDSLRTNMGINAKKSFEENYTIEKTIDVFEKVIVQM